MDVGGLIARGALASTWQSDQPGEADFFGREGGTCQPPEVGSPLFHHTPSLTPDLT